METLLHWLHNNLNILLARFGNGGLLATFRRPQGNLAALDMEAPHAKEESQTLTFNLSFDRLPEADRRRLAQPGVFAATEPFDAAPGQVRHAQERVSSHVASRRRCAPRNDMGRALPCNRQLTNDK